MSGTSAGRGSTTFSPNWRAIFRPKSVAPNCGIAMPPVATTSRDARITPIYEGTNGIQAADLVGRKLTGDNGGALSLLIADMRGDAESAELIRLIDACEEVGWYLLAADSDDRLAASYPFLTMLSVAVCGWLMEEQGRAAVRSEGDPAFLKAKAAVTRFYVEQIVPEAMGLKAAAMAPAAALYAIDAEGFATR